MIRVEPVGLEWANALSEGADVFTDRFDIAVVSGWNGFDRVLPFLLRYVQSGEPPQWGPHLFFDDDGSLVGNGGWKGPPVDGVAELGYAVAPERQGRGIASSAVRQMLSQARSTDLRIAYAHTLGLESVSTSVLRRCGFAQVADIADPEHGVIWRWEKKLTELAARTPAPGAVT